MIATFKSSMEALLMLRLCGTQRYDLLEILAHVAVISHSNSGLSVGYRRDACLKIL